MSEWQPVETAPEGVLVDTVIREGRVDRNHKKLARFGHMWFVDERRSSYEYYRPTHWRPLTEGDAQ